MQRGNPNQPNQNNNQDNPNQGGENISRLVLGIAIAGHLIRVRFLLPFTLAFNLQELQLLRQFLQNNTPPPFNLLQELQQLQLFQQLLLNNNPQINSQLNNSQRRLFGLFAAERLNLQFVNDEEERPVRQWRPPV